MSRLMIPHIDQEGKKMYYSYNEAFWEEQDSIQNWIQADPKLLKGAKKAGWLWVLQGDTGVKAPTCWSGLVRFKISIAYKGECIQVFLSACPYIRQKGNWAMGRRIWNLWAVKDQRWIGLHHNSLCVWLSELCHVWNCLKPQWYFVSQRSV